MVSVLIVFILSIAICCAIAYIMGLFWFSDMRNRRLLSFYLLGVEIFIWTLLNAITMISHQDYFPVIYTFRMILVCIVPFGVTWFVLNFINSPICKFAWVRNLFILLPAIDIICMVTNPLHHLYFANYDFPMPERAPIFWAHIIIDFSLIIVVFILLIRYILKNAKRNPLLILTGIGMLIPYTINILYSFGMMPLEYDITPIGFFVTFLLFVFVAYRSQLFNLKTALFSSTMDSLDDLIIICNEKHIIMDVNQRALEVFSEFPMVAGRTKSEEFLKYLNGAAADIKPEGLIDSFAKDPDADGEFTITLANGEKRTYTVNARTVYVNNRKSGCILVCTDVSNYREMISEINKRNDELFDLKIEAEQISRYKSEFLSRMSHEMRTPMNAIMGMTAVAQNSNDPEKKEYCLSRIDDASRHLLSLINDILDISKIEADKFELDLAEFDFGRMISNVLNISKFRMDEKEQELTVSIDKAIPPVLIGDEQRLIQVINHLLINAAKFTPEKGLINFNAKICGEENGVYTLQIEITDNGIGIAKNIQERLFHSFEQADGSITRKFGGTGLGLAISKRIVELMGGEIWVESELGEGSKFAFTFKAEKGNGENENTSAQSLRQNVSAADSDVLNINTKKLNSYEGKRILLAEDIELNREIFIAMLDDIKIEIECAENGQEAFDMFKAEPGRYDIIFMDMQMPEVDGIEATKRIRALDDPRAASVPIVAVTANVLGEDIEKCLEAGMNDHVGKPINIDELMYKIDKYII